uniref:Sushi domain-containing protein n=1 Tax=Cricetulus griseus TaxID=10029 RepID=A0A8C2MFT3_CRIGR
KIQTMRLSARIIWLILWTVCVAEDCKGPPPKENTEILSGSWPDQPYPEGIQATYKCRPGYRTLGTIVKVCKGGKWVASNPSRICRKRPCGHPGDTPFGSFSLAVGTAFEFGAKVVYTCNEGYQLLGEIDYRECDADGWTNDIPLCEVVKCLPVTEPENGRIVSGSVEPDQEYYFGQVVRFDCNAGFKVEGQKAIHCSENGLWSSEKPRCVEISCTPPVVANGQAVSKKPVYKENERYQYQCDRGFVYRERGDAVCTVSGWSPQPACEERECSIPLLEKNLTVNPKKEKYKVGDFLKFSCRPGYRVGPDSVQCYHFGWSPRFPTCKGEVESCDQPPELLNGEFKGTKKEEYGHGDVVEYDCKPRFLLKGPNKIQCVDGKWTSLPICVEEKRTCGDIPELEHGSAQFSLPPYHHGDSVEFTCIENFTMIGHGSISCISGRWTQLPQCVATDQLEKCKAPKAKDKEAIQPNRNEFNHNVSVSYKCRGKQEYKHSICINGRWDPEPTCTNKGSCPPPPQIPNAQEMQTTVKYWDGEKVSVLCQDNYLIQNTEEMVCKNGRWQSLPRCIAKIPCSEPPEIDHGRIILPRSSEERRETDFSRRHEHGITLNYVCDDGFMMAEDHGVTCHMGKWSSPPRCVGLPCGPPPSIPHGIVSHGLDSYQYGEEVTYSCAEGFGVSGQAFMKCVGGTWSQPPACIRTDCDSLPRFENAILIEEEKDSYRSGEQVTFKCAPSYQMNGSNIVTCVNRTWIGEVVCKDTSCGEPPHVENATILTRPMARYPSNERVRYECNKPFELFGEVEVMCQNGIWTEPPKCRDSTGKCGPPPPIDNGDITSFPLSVYAPLSSVEYQCQSLYQLQGNKKITYACVISEEIIKRHNITYRWIRDQKLYSQSGEFVEFACKYGYEATDSSPPFRTRCIDGHIDYPSC